MFALKRSVAPLGNAFCVVVNPSVAIRSAAVTAAAQFHSSPLCSCCGQPAWLAHPSKSDKKLLNKFLNGDGRKSFTTALSGDVSDSDLSPHVTKLLENNKQWVAENKKNDPNFLNKIAGPQKPQYLYFGCSDSRVPANEILGLGPGEVFVHRNIGNQVPGNDLNVLSVLEFAVGHLGIKDIIVTGHYDCGAVRAASSRQDLGTLENWLRLIRDVHRLHKETLGNIADAETRHKALVELNVVEQCLNVFKTGVVQRKRIQVRKEFESKGLKGQELENEVYPRIHGMVFNPKEGGLLKPIPVDFNRRIGSLDHIYGLY